MDSLIVGLPESRSLITKRELEALRRRESGAIFQGHLIKSGLPRLTSNAAAVEASWSFSTVSICLNISLLIPDTCNVKT